MFYKPKFCCNCGEKIERIEWWPWTSRRFCEPCEKEHRPHDLVPRVVVALGILAGLFGVGAYFQSPETGGSAVRPVPLAAKSKKPVPETQRLEAATQGPNAQKAVNSNAANGAADLEKKILPEASFEQTGRKKASSDEPVYYCGALTKKGTPCTRRVKVKGRCWQHAGTAANERMR